ncbi:hypothetical protein GSI_14201 [Ganoderma sinense ZZ0214-1]|uniref:F-box domain-containing protein n=1 Tax=Ganoderma sinense ZZ0214-1 TaxID=1077348 RepID=A0A2G8RSG1_9APHY|nr:hypothetical protein GSI_14201 [Ganoderma sinense ZZ0214-1]
MTKDTPLRCRADLLAFYRFLRPGDPSSRTADLVRDLRFQIGPSPVPANHRDRRQLPEIGQDEAIEAFIGILDHCRRLRRLHIVQLEWDLQVPPSLLFHTLSHLTLLEDLEINLDEEVEPVDLHQLAALPLRRLTCLWAPRMAPQFGEFAAIAPLARTLVELDLPMYAHKCKLFNATFPSVRKVALWVPRGRAFVTGLCSTFPGLSHLTLRGQCPWTHQWGTWIVHGGEATNETIRETHVEQWKGLPGAWPDLAVVRVEDPRTAYLLGLDRSVASLSLAWLSYTPESAFVTAVEDTHPTCVEFVMDLPTYMGSMSVGGGPYGALSQLDSISSLQYLVVHLRKFSIQMLCGESVEPIHLLASALEDLPVTHLVIKLDLGPFGLHVMERDRVHTVVDYGQDVYNAEDGVKLLDAAETWATLIAGSSRTLQWIAVYVPRDRVRSWEVSRQAGGEEDELEAALWELEEDEAWDVLSAESLREFM